MMMVLNYQNKIK